MADYKKCPACGKTIPFFDVSNDLAYRLEALCKNKQFSLGLGEIISISHMNESEAREWLEHFDECDMDIVFTPDDLKIIAQIYFAFGQISQPEQFADPQHCWECAEHNATLRARPRESLRRRDLGTSGWDPLNFIEPNGIAYLLPTLTRFALAPEVKGYEWYGERLAWHLSWKGKENPLLNWCTSDQRKAILLLIQHLLSTRSDQIAATFCDEYFLEAERLWQQYAT